MKVSATSFDTPAGALNAIENPRSPSLLSQRSVTSENAPGLIGHLLAFVAPNHAMSSPGAADVAEAARVMRTLGSRMIAFTAPRASAPGRGAGLLTADRS